MFKEVEFLIGVLVASKEDLENEGYILIEFKGENETGMIKYRLNKKIIN